MFRNYLLKYRFVKIKKACRNKLDLRLSLHAAISIPKRYRKINRVLLKTKYLCCHLLSTFRFHTFVYKIFYCLFTESSIFKNYISAIYVTFLSYVIYKTKNQSPVPQTTPGTHKFIKTFYIFIPHPSPARNQSSGKRNN